MTIRIITGDCRDVLATLPDASVQCVVTSPPYYGLRAYLPDGHEDKCREIGSEATPDEFVATLVAVFREVRRVLRPDGTLWLNLGSSYSNGKGSNVTEQLNRLLEGGSVFFADTHSRGVAGHGVGIALEHERAPKGELTDLLGSERNAVEHGHKDFCKIADLFADPGAIWAGPAVLRMVVNPTDAEVALDKVEHGAVIGAQCDTQSEAILAVLRSAGARAGEDDEAALAIHEADEPRVAGNVRWHTAWHTFARNAVSKGTEDIHLVDQAIALGNRPETLAGLLCDFRVTKASEKQITLTGIKSGLTLTISDVGQLWFVLRCGSVVPYTKLYVDASRFANALLPKQDLGMPWRLARALQEDGWILRSPIIWAKPNPMPESVTDRPTSAHEHVFLLAKSARYFFDAEAVREPHENGAYWIGREPTQVSKGNADRGDNGGRAVSGSSAGRNIRNVWTIVTAPYAEAHFATFPPELAERCIRAGTSERGCCSKCGAPWVRQVAVTPEYAAVRTEYARIIAERDTKEGRLATGAISRPSVPDVRTFTTGWAPSCGCRELRCNKCSFVLATKYGKEASTKHRVSDVRGNVQTVEERADMLQSDVPQSVAKDVARPDVRAVRQSVSPAVEQNPDVQFGLFAEVDRTQSQNNQRLDDHQQGLQTASKTGPSERNGRRLRDGASPGDGEEAWPASDEGRGGSPQERQQAGQSDQQPGIDGEASTRRASQADLSCDLPELSACVPDTRTCPHCGSHAEWTTPATVPAVVLDIFAGAGTTLLVADRLQRDAVGIELNQAYASMTRNRLTADAGMFAAVAD